MHAGNAVLDAVNVQAAFGQLDLLPLQVADLRDPQAVPIGNQDHGRVAMPIATMLPSTVHQPVNLTLGEVASLDCQVFDGWSAFSGPRFHRNKAPILEAYWLSYPHFLNSHKGRIGEVHRNRNAGWRRRGGCAA